MVVPSFFSRCFAALGWAAALSIVAGPSFGADPPPAAAGLSVRTSPYPVDRTVEKIVATATERGLTVFATIDHAAGARRVGLTMKPTVLIVLGNPKGGTPVMVASPSAAIDLPLKVLVAEDAGGTTVVTINEPGFVQQRHSIPAVLLPAISGLGPLLDAALQ